MKLPESFVKEGLELTKDATLFGIKLDELSHDELLAACAMGWKSYNDQLQSSISHSESLRKMRLSNI